jgi:hypothetical protein
VGGVRHDGEAARVVAAQQLTHHEQEAQDAGEGELPPRQAAGRPIRPAGPVAMARDGGCAPLFCHGDHGGWWRDGPTAAVEHGDAAGGAQERSHLFMLVCRVAAAAVVATAAALWIRVAGVLLLVGRVQSGGSGGHKWN